MLRPTSPAVLPELSEREREILDLTARGQKYPEIASHHFLCLMTVRNHVLNILTKLHFADRTEAIIWARDAGLG